MRYPEDNRREAKLKADDILEQAGLPSYTDLVACLATFKDNEHAVKLVKKADR